MDDTVHIASLLVHCRPELLPALLANLQCLPDVELHQHSAEGKLVVVLETRHEQQILERIEQLQQNIAKSKNELKRSLEANKVSLIDENKTRSIDPMPISMNFRKHSQNGIPFPPTHPPSSWQRPTSNCKRDQIRRKNQRVSFLYFHLS